MPCFLTPTTSAKVPRLLDLFCGAGGAGMGYSRAGFEIVGVDINPMPRYPFEFHQADALEYLAEHGHEFDAIHASPPCQGNSALRFKTGKTYQDWIIRTREILTKTGKPWVIENVVGAKLIDPVLLCGTMFGLKVIRHRLFENSIGLAFPPFSCNCDGDLVGRRGHLGDREYMTITGHFSNIEKARTAMGIDWMGQKELAQAIPPAYTNFIGEHLLSFLLYGEHHTGDSFPERTRDTFASLDHKKGCHQNTNGLSDNGFFEHSSPQECEETAASFRQLEQRPNDLD